MLVALAVGEGVTRLALTPLELVQRRVGQVDVAVFHQLRHEAEQQGQQQGGDVLAVHVGVRHQHDLVVAQLGDVELVVDAGAERGDDRLDLGVFQHTIHARLLHVQDLAAQRQDCLVHGVAAALGGAACRVTLHDEQLGLGRVLGAAVRELAGQAAQVGGGFAAHQIAGLARRLPGLRGRHRLVHNGLGLGRVGVEPIREVFVHRALDKTLDLSVAQLRLGLALKLRVGHAHGHHGC